MEVFISMWDYTDASSLFFNNQNIEDFVMSEEPKPDQQIGQIHLNNTMMWDFGFKSQESNDVSAIEQKIKGIYDYIQKIVNWSFSEIITGCPKSRDLPKMPRCFKTNQFT